MKIIQIDLFQVTYNLKAASYAWSRGNAVSAFLSTIVKVSTDEGIDGFGESCPLGSAYLPAFAAGIPAGVGEIGPALLGQDPRQLNVIHDAMDAALAGHPYIKSPVDMACWDILGKASGMPVCTLLGGRRQERVPLYRAISQRTAEGMKEDVARYRSEGYRRFQLKVGGNADDDIARIRAALGALQDGDILVADANTGWIMRDAIRVVNALADADIFVEQPCRTLDECLTVRAHTRQPFVLDEIITDVPALLAAHRQQAMDIVNIKISRVGGLSRAKQMRDLCESLGIAMTLEDSWGGDITTAAIAHFAGSTRPEFYFTATDFNSYNDLSVAEDAPRRQDGFLPVPDAPGLGIHVDEGKLGEALLTIK